MLLLTYLQWWCLCCCCFRRWLGVSYTGHHAVQALCRCVLLQFSTFLCPACGYSSRLCQFARFSLWMKVKRSWTGVTKVGTHSDLEVPCSGYDLGVKGHSAGKWLDVVQLTGLYVFQEPVCSHGPKINGLRYTGNLCVIWVGDVGKSIQFKVLRVRSNSGYPVYRASRGCVHWRCSYFAVFLWQFSVICHCFLSSRGIECLE